MQKKHHNCKHNVKPLPKLQPGQPALFVSSTDSESYIEGTITGPTTTPRSYMIEAQGRIYYHTRQHIYLINIDTPIPFSRPSMHQDTPITGPSTHQASPMMRPCSKHSHCQNCQNTAISPHYSAQQHQAITLQSITLQSITLQTATLYQQVTFLPHTISPLQNPLTTPVTSFQDPSTILLAPLQDHQCPDLMTHSKVQMSYT